MFHERRKISNPKQAQPITYPGAAKNLLYVWCLWLVQHKMVIYIFLIVLSQRKHSLLIFAKHWVSNFFMNAIEQQSTPEDILRDALETHEKIALSFSGAEDVVLIHMARQFSDCLSVFCLDTGRLHPETYQFIESIRDAFEIDIDLISPNPQDIEKLVKQKGLFSFYKDGHQECCNVRKIIPLRRHLSRFDAWITGQRKDQSLTRSLLPHKQIDEAFSSEKHQLTKYNPLAEWTSSQVWHYIRSNEIPYNKLHDQGFQSIGCEPCTRPTGPGQHEREGRWWWEQEVKKECGLHAVNLKSHSE